MCANKWWATCMDKCREAWVKLVYLFKEPRKNVWDIIKVLLVLFLIT